MRDCRLLTLANHFRLPHQPCHRALDDALATADLLHALLERAGSLGVLGLDDLLELPTIRAHPQVNKLRLTAKLPRRPGVYVFRGRGDRVLYVGKATDLRSRVRSYFSGDTRRKVAQLLREVERIDHVVCTNTLEAGVLEVRLIHEHLPPFNRQAKLWGRYAYLKLTLDERWPRLSIVRVPKRGDGCLYLGPLASRGAARLVADAIETAAPLRRCTQRPGRDQRAWPCAPAQLGVAACPCAGTSSDAEYGAVVDRVVRGLTVEPGLLLEPLGARMAALASAGRFEEAADIRDCAAALARALHRQRRLEGLRRAGRIELLAPDGQGAVLDGGRLLAPGTLLDPPPADADDLDLPLPRHLADELACVGTWLDAEAGRLRLVHCDGELASPLPRLPRFEPRRTQARDRPSRVPLSVEVV